MNLELLLLDCKNHFETIVRRNGMNVHVYTFDTKKEAIAFFTGFQCAKEVINNLVQSVPLGYTDRKEVSEY